MENYIGKKCIVRCHMSGVFFGTILEREGTRVRIGKVRNLWYWDGAASVMQLASEGVKRPSNCKFTVVVEEIMVEDAIQTIPCNDKAIKSIESVEPWKR